MKIEKTAMEVSIGSNLLTVQNKVSVLLVLSIVLFLALACILFVKKARYAGACCFMAGTSAVFYALHKFNVVIIDGADYNRPGKLMASEFYLMVLAVFVLCIIDGGVKKVLEKAGWNDSRICSMKLTRFGIMAFASYGVGIMYAVLHSYFYDLSTFGLYIKAIVYGIVFFMYSRIAISVCSSYIEDDGHKSGDYAETQTSVIPIRPIKPLVIPEFMRSTQRKSHCGSGYAGIRKDNIVKFRPRRKK